MSGHSKWSKIKRQKGVLDAKKGKIFTKLVRQIIVCARDGGVDPESNSSLRLAIEKAREASMPTANIKRALDKVAGNIGANKFEDVVYEAHGPSKVAILIEAMTDNRARTVANIRQILNKNGGSLSDGGVSWMFEHRGVIAIETNESNAELALELAVNSDVLELEEDEESLYLETKMEDFNKVLSIFRENSFVILESSLEYIPTSNTTTISEEENEKLENLIELLEEDDDVQGVYTNVK